MMFDMMMAKGTSLANSPCPSRSANTAFTATDTYQHLDPVQTVKHMGSTLQSRFPCSLQQM